MRALVKSSARMRAFGWRSFAIRAVIGSISTPVSVVLASSASGMRAKKRPVPHPGSRTRPPEKPMRPSARHITLPMNSGVKCAYCVTRARLASSPGETSCSRSSPRVSQPFGKASSGEPRKRLLARSPAPKDVKMARRSCSSGAAFRVRDLAHHSDGGDVVRRARLPVGAKAASARETEVARRNNDRRGGVFLSLDEHIVDRLAKSEAGIEAYRGRQGGRVKERQAQLVWGGLHCDGNLSGARDRPVGVW